MISPATVQYDVSGLPQAVRDRIATVDADLSAPWGLAERERTLTYPWSALNGFTQTKLEAVEKLLGLYRRMGWEAAIVDRNQTTLRLRFSPTGG